MDQRIATYVPRHPTAAWRRVEDRVRRLVSAAEPVLERQVSESMSTLARLATFCDAHGILEPEQWLRPETVEHFLVAGCPNLSAATKASYRARLRRLAQATYPEQSTPAQPLAASPAAQPYSSAELAALWSWAQGRPTAELRHGLTVLLCLGAGAGLLPEEVVPLHAGAVRPCGNGSVVVHVPGPRRRLVVCRTAWEGPLRESLAAAEHSYLFRPGAHRRGKNTISNFVARAQRDHRRAPALSVSRLRSTWLLDHLTAQTPLSVIVAAAGLSSLRGLDHLLPLLPTLDGELAQQSLRGDR